MDAKTITLTLRFLAYVIVLGWVAIVSLVLGLLVKRERAKELAAELPRVHSDRG
jgi:hypothetical protein